MLGREFNAVSIAGRQKFRPVIGTAAPDRPYGVDDVPGRQAITLRQFRLACLAATKEAALMDQFRPGGAVNSAVDAASAKKLGVGCVDDCIYRKLGDVALNCAKNG